MCAALRPGDFDGRVIERRPRLGMRDLAPGLVDEPETARRKLRPGASRTCPRCAAARSCRSMRAPTRLDQVFRPGRRSTNRRIAGQPGSEGARPPKSRGSTGGVVELVAPLRRDRSLVEARTSSSTSKRVSGRGHDPGLPSRRDRHGARLRRLSIQQGQSTRLTCTRGRLAARPRRQSPELVLVQHPSGKEDREDGSAGRRVRLRVLRRSDRR